jgi:hypothetical protein
MASMSKSLAEMNKSGDGVRATKHRPFMCWENALLPFLPHNRAMRAEFIPLCQLAPVSRWLGPSLLLTEEEHRYEHH